MKLPTIHLDLDSPMVQKTVMKIELVHMEQHEKTRGASLGSKTPPSARSATLQNDEPKQQSPIS